MTRLGSKKLTWPRPSQRGQAPIGLLNENRRGSSSGSEYPHTGQAKRAEKMCSRPESISTANARPSEWRSAVSKDSARRCLASGRTFRRSTTTSTVCFLFFASLGMASSSCTSPSTRTRTKPCARRSSIKSCCSPLRPTMSGERIIRRVSAGRLSA